MEFPESSHYGKQFDSSTNVFLKIESLYDLAVPLLGMYPKGLKIEALAG